MHVHVIKVLVKTQIHAERVWYNRAGKMHFSKFVRAYACICTYAYVYTCTCTRYIYKSLFSCALIATSIAICT